MTAFRQRARESAIEWKLTSPLLHDRDRAEGTYRGTGPYPFCLPAGSELMNLLPDARDVGLSRFKEAHIPWHSGTLRGPCSHLLSSQVQCVNALAPFVADPRGLRALFAGVLPIAEVLPFAAAAPDVSLEVTMFDRKDFVVFEWIGMDNYLGEHDRGSGTRGANNTSADAAIRYRNNEGQIEIALIEWKYTEYYSATAPAGAKDKDAVRTRRYRHLVDDPEGPINLTFGLGFANLLVEPVYQLMRQQLLAWQMERSAEFEATVVRVCHCGPSANTALFDRLPPGQLRTASMAAGIGASGVLLGLWDRLLRRPDRFTHFDTASLVTAASPMSAEFKHRYGDLGSNLTAKRESRRPEPCD